LTFYSEYLTSCFCKYPGLFPKDDSLMGFVWLGFGIQGTSLTIYAINWFDFWLGIFWAVSWGVFS